MSLRYWPGCTTDPEWMAEFSKSVKAFWREEAMSDIVERLRDGRMCQGSPCRVKEASSGCDCAEAADEIERLRAALDAQSIQYLAGQNIISRLCTEIDEWRQKAMAFLDPEVERLKGMGEQEVDLADALGHGPSAPGWFEPKGEEAMSDIVERLRSYEHNSLTENEAADEIERLREIEDECGTWEPVYKIILNERDQLQAEIERLRAQQADDARQYDAMLREQKQEIEQLRALRALVEKSQ